MSNCSTRSTELLLLFTTTHPSFTLTQANKTMKIFDILRSSILASSVSYTYGHYAMAYPPPDFGVTDAAQALADAYKPVQAFWFNMGTQIGCKEITVHETWLHMCFDSNVTLFDACHLFYRAWVALDVVPSLKAPKTKLKETNPAAAPP